MIYTPELVSVQSIRPLIRYVDKDIAVINLLLDLKDHCSSKTERRKHHPRLQVLAHLRGPTGRTINIRSPLETKHKHATAQFEIDHPQIWWPAGMGDQSLYALNVKTLADNSMIDNRDISLGLASVRTSQAIDHYNRLLVNGQPCSIRTIVPITPADETQLLAAGSDSLLLVHDHFGPDLLYDAADRAGLLMLQSIPVPPDDVVRGGGKKFFNVVKQVDRLTGHPSLAGWFVGQIGKIADQVASRIHSLDPTHVVFRHIPAN